MDKRQLKSRKLLRTAMVELLRKVPYADITIQMITNQADTARVTFYRHYGTKEELLMDLVREGTERFDIQTQDAPLSLDYLLDFNNIPPTYFMFSLYEQDRFLHKNLYTSPALTLLSNGFRTMSYHRILSVLKAGAEKYPELPMPFIAQHVMMVNWSYLYWWVVEDIPYSADHMGKLAHYTGMMGAFGLIGRTDLIILPDEGIDDLLTMPPVMPAFIEK